ncbi:hypothetical protein BB560_006733 [Smittium megazygosporum]|uniref:Uncharacterized protein n=1 Tax=Smittium megazygosporum TaxID=133381 RepID=A0A2T9Y252_9FUNG|nr:hypothetical protein BB560_006733 [Smittium megazygosporum]
MSDPFDDWESAFDAGIDPIVPNKKPVVADKELWENAQVFINKNIEPEVSIENQERTFYRPTVKIISRKNNENKSSESLKFEPKKHFIPPKNEASNKDILKKKNNPSLAFAP